MLARGSKRGSAEGSMPSTRGIGSKMMCCCSLALFGVISRKPISPNANCGRSSGQRTVASSILGQLNSYTRPNGFLCNSLLDLVEEEVWTARGSFGLVEIFVACQRQHPITPVAAFAGRVGKLECGYREKRLPRKARRNRFGDLYKFQSSGMRTKEPLDGIGVRPDGIGGDQC